jgi:hypothetical protein
MGVAEDNPDVKQSYRTWETLRRNMYSLQNPVLKQTPGIKEQLMIG